MEDYSANRTLLRIFGGLKNHSILLEEQIMYSVWCTTVHISFTLKLRVLANVWRIKANFPKCTGCLIQSDIGITRIAVWKFYCLNSYYRELLEQYFVFSKSARIKLVDYWVFLNSMWTAFYHFLTMFYAWTQYIVDLKSMRMFEDIYILFII